MYLVFEHHCVEKNQKIDLMTLDAADQTHPFGHLLKDAHLTCLASAL
uniref:Uncharacterized protein n=1 Tax=Rhizophora mucronata TaxID=61149 RepID=A0A2P2MZQ1_RHIMU